MSYFGNLSKEQITDAEKRKKELIFEINEQLGNLIREYHEARHGGYISKSREFRLLKEKLEQRMEDITHMYLPIFLKRYPKIIKKIETENPGDFVRMPSTRRQKKILISVLVALFVIWRSHNFNWMIVSFLISWVFISILDSRYEHPPVLEARV